MLEGGGLPIVVLEVVVIKEVEVDVIVVVEVPETEVLVIVVAEVEVIVVAEVEVVVPEVVVGGGTLPPAVLNWLLYCEPPTHAWKVGSSGLLKAMLESSRLFAIACWSTVSTTPWFQSLVV